jgi:N-acyl homoserine lactone hydrolase
MIKLTVLDWGTMRLDSMILRGRVNMMTLREGASFAHEWMDAPVWGALIETDGHKILFDLGCHPDGMSGLWPAAIREGTPWYHAAHQTVEAQLALLGLTPADIDTVVASHTHVDHFGNIGLFTHADVYVPKEDWVSALVTMHRTSDETWYGQCIPAILDVRPKEFHPVPIGGDFELFPGVEVITLPGHTLNLLGLVVRLEQGPPVILTSDAVFLNESLKRPIRPSGSMADSLRYIESVEKVLALQKKLGAEIWPGHDMALFRSLKKAPEFYC